MRGPVCRARHGGAIKVFDFSGVFARLARRLLYVWVRTAQFPEQPAGLGLDPAKPVCYVLQDRHLSDLLVLFEETRRGGLPLAEAPARAGGLRTARSFFFLNRSHGLTTPARERYGHSPLMTRLVRAAQADPALDVQLVPVVILWGRAPDKQESILKALFAETWRTPGPLRQFLAILLHGRHVLVRFNAPISLRGLLADGLDEASALRKLSRVLRVHFRRQREMAIGPDLSHRNTQIDALLGAPPVRAAIAAEATRLGVSPGAAETRARGFALEIASDYSYGVVRALDLFLSWLWTRLYDGVEVHNFDAVTRIAPGHGIVYVPCHRSHVDYLLLSWLIHRNGLTPPHIAAGANLDMPLVGPLLRRGGAFFLRRSFKGEPLYAAVFHEYLHLMLARGFPIEYFIEGGRSRSGRTLMPKAGILGMTVNSFLREHARPLVFVPVYIGYEKIIEGATYVRELAGQPKRRESLWGLLRSARSIRRVFGRVHVNFGEPLPLAEYLDGLRPGWRAGDTAGGDDAGPTGGAGAAPPATDAAGATDTSGTDWPRAATRGAAGELARRINEAAVITPVNLIALALLATPRLTADEHALHRQIEHYLALSRQAPYAPTVIGCALEPAQIVAHAERLGIVERLPHPLGDLIRVREGEGAQLAWFRNNVLHLFALPGLIACLLGHNRLLDPARLSGAVAGIYTLLGAELFLHWTPAELPAAIDECLAVFAERGLLQRTFGAGRLAAPEASSQESVELQQLGETVRPTLERHFLTLALLQQRGSGRLTRAALADDCHLLAQRLALLDTFEIAEFAEKTLFSGLLANLVDSELLHEDAAGLLHFDERITTPLADAELVLPAEARRAIRRMAGTGSA